MKKCPYCAEEIQEEAVKCKHCGEFLSKSNLENIPCFIKYSVYKTSKDYPDDYLGYVRAKNREDALERSLEVFKSENINRDNLKITESPNIPTATLITDEPEQGSLTLKILGGLLLVAGAIVATYYFYHFDTTVTVEPVEIMGKFYGGGGKVNNIGLLQDRQNGIIIGVALAVMGLICMAIGSFIKRR
ncbi:MAG: zinc ribbon domain-containing protein [Planctomycetota bacterium]